MTKTRKKLQDEVTLWDESVEVIVVVAVNPYANVAVVVAALPLQHDSLDGPGLHRWLWLLTVKIRARVG